MDGFCQHKIHMDVSMAERPSKERRKQLRVLLDKREGRRARISGEGLFFVYQGRSAGVLRKRIDLTGSRG